MNKTLIKRLLFDLIEALVRLEQQTLTLEQTAPLNLLPYLKAVRGGIAGIKTQLWSYRDSFLKLYEDTPLEDSQAESYLTNVFPHLLAQVTPLTKALYRIQKGQVLPELELFLASLNLGKLLPDTPQPIVLPALDNEDREALVPTESLLLEYLPTLSLQTPLHWVGILNTFSRHFCEKTLQVLSLLEELNLPEPKTSVITPLINLRLLGPGFYARYVLNAFQQADAVALWAVEPILFQALNRFGLVNKDLVILHQSVEKGRQHRGIAEPHGLKVLAQDEVRDRLLKVVEKVVPERLSFTEKAFMRTQLLEERLGHGLLISAVPILMSPAQLLEDLGNLPEERTIYPILQQLQETPATPREIINAGWLYKLDQTPSWLQTALQTDSHEGWDFLRQTILGLDTVLLKSIEISEVHRMLSHEETEHLVPA